MSAGTNRLSSFWKVLKRRRVVYVITVYASAAFVIIELVTNLTEPFNLPANLATILIIVLAIGFPLITILSWFYDLTGKGIEKTKPLTDTVVSEKVKVPNAWKIATYVSFALIIGLVTFNILGGPDQLRAGNTQTIMILPIDNYTGDDQLDDFISGMHAVLISDVGRISGLKVLSRITSVAYAEKSISQIVAETGVDVILKPTFMCLADSICFHMNEVTLEGEQSWIPDYRESKSQLPNLTNLITKEIAEEIRVKLTASEERMLSESKTVDPDAYEAWINGQTYWDQLNQKDLEHAKMYFERAIEIDPDWAPPYASLSITWGTLMSFGTVPDSVGLPKQYEYLNKALELDPNDSDVQFSLAVLAVWTEWDWEKGERAFVASLERNPNAARSHGYYAHLLIILRRYEDALNEARLAMEVDPLNPLIMGLYVVVLTNIGHCEEAREIYETAISIDPNHSFLRGKLASIYQCLGDYDKVYELWRDMVYPLWERFGVSELLDRTYREQGYFAFVEEESRINREIMSKEISFQPLYFFNQNLNLGHYDQAMDYLEMVYNDHSHNKNIDLAYIGSKPYYDKLKDNPRYIALLKKMNLPVE
jgi:tetratricopeptide (TPR) repeat protein/TolB-like protein